VNDMIKAQQRYREEAILSASPERLVTMLYDRLLLDVDRAINAQTAGNWQEANLQLQHAQAIVAQLSGSLTDEWDGAGDLRALYAYLATTLINANVTRNVELTQECRDHIAPLRDAFHQAAASLAGAA